MVIKAIIEKRVFTQIVTEKNIQEQEIEWLTDEYDDTIDINQIIQDNMNNQIKEVIETEVVELEYETEYKNNGSLPKGMIQVLQQGQDGKQELIIKKQYEGDELVLDEQIGRRIVTPSIDRIVEVGTSSYYNKYTIKTNICQVKKRKNRKIYRKSLSAFCREADDHVQNAVP